MDCSGKCVVPVCRWAVKSVKAPAEATFLVLDKDNDYRRLIVALRHIRGDSSSLILSPILVLPLSSWPIFLLRYTHEGMDDTAGCPVVQMRLNRKADLDGGPEYRRA